MHIADGRWFLERGYSYYCLPSDSSFLPLGFETSRHFYQLKNHNIQFLFIQLVFTCIKGWNILSKKYKSININLQSSLDLWTKELTLKSLFSHQPQQTYKSLYWMSQKLPLFVSWVRLGLFKYTGKHVGIILGNIFSIKKVIR